MRQQVFCCLPGDASKNTHYKVLQKNLLVKSRFNHGKQAWVKTEVVWFHSNSNLKIYGNPPEGMLTGVTGLLDIA